MCLSVLFRVTILKGEKEETTGKHDSILVLVSIIVFLEPQYIYSLLKKDINIFHMSTVCQTT